jgi:lipopolysaccharide/colanic/teichoic acid biosynthesis glycosyltransferase
MAARTIDVGLSGIGLLALSPVIALIAAAVRLDSSGPIFYRQRRVGLDRRTASPPAQDGARRTSDFGGRPFEIYKFRTMEVSAEHETGPVWSSRNDARITRVGRWLRNYRFDELPQLLNVLKGDMSIVGPRPERPHIAVSLATEVSDYQRRHRVLPGITGWAQVHLGYDTSVDGVREKLEYDLEYIDNRSLALDLRIMLMTVPVVLRGKAFLGN